MRPCLRVRNLPGVGRHHLTCLRRRRGCHWSCRPPGEEWPVTGQPGARSPNGSGPNWGAGTARHVELHCNALSEAVVERGWSPVGSGTYLVWSVIAPIADGGKRAQAEAAVGPRGECRAAEAWGHRGDCHAALCVPPMVCLATLNPSFTTGSRH
ncbi:hypothetical protein NDU88_006640 [Pleurodeles waltl]|uniref:Uncharacterized protein n=1 Tax=Pleurodeles waltl TaxID=8319 RepID=A0AAV7VS52_PLEWA|nr:hypothetical protein NDU88_006640 [Pleurodeles waltl]